VEERGLFALQSDVGLSLSKKRTEFQLHRILTLEFARSHYDSDVQPRRGRSHLLATYMSTHSDMHAMAKY
jgi:hypothetical protein